MKRKFFLIFMLAIVLFGVQNVFARSSESNSIGNKTPIKYKGITLYASVEVNFDMDSSGFAKSKALIKNVSAYYDEKSNTFYFSVKRSDINKAFGKKYDNVYSLLETYIDYHQPTAEGGYLKQLNHESTDCGYTYTFNKSDYYYNNHKYLELFSSSIPLSGTYGPQKSIGGGIAVFNNDNGFVDSKEYCRSDFANKNAVIDLTKTISVVSIVEDVKIDLGENNNVISSESNFASENAAESLKKEDINNFYAEYNAKKELQYSWTLYDENGNPVEINYNTEIGLDESEYQDNIQKLFDYEEEDIDEKLKFISFKHEGDLGGRAKVSIYVGDKFEKGSKLNLFYFDEDKENLDKINEEQFIVVDDKGYATFEIDHCSEYVLADSQITVKDNSKTSEKDNKEVKKSEKTDDKKIKKSTLIVIIVSSVIVVAIIVFIIIKVVKKKKVKKTKEKTKEE